MRPPSADRIDIAGIPVDNLTQEETVNLIGQIVRRGESRYMTVVNAAKVAAARNNPELRGVISNAALVTADGMSVVWASKLLGKGLKARVTGIDLFEQLVGYAADNSLSVYFLGAREESVSSVVERFKSSYQPLRVAGYRNGYFKQDESNAVADQIRNSGADLLFVAMGSPAQEFWIARHLNRSGVRFALGVGGSFDHLSGYARRAPRWMQNAGLEWLYRLMREPRRLWRRYLIGNTVFLWLVAKQRMRLG